ncbi:MAG: nucleotidyltransferase domain-containing protein [Mariniphaga sp.]|nr:nucleotidyltransferase domain-containing protein [Mariniphaga sp.]
MIKKKIVRRVSEIDPDAEVYLFGSRARGDFKKDSDWDLLILTNYPVTLKDEQRYRHHLIPLELETGEAFSTLYQTREN